MSDPVAEDLAAVTFPGDLPAGTTLLVAGAFPPPEQLLGLRALCRYGGAGDVAHVVTTTADAGTTRRQYAALPGNGPALGVVDTQSERQYMPSVYTAEPTVLTPSPGDLERLVMALSDLAGGGAPPGGTRHLLVRSLTPMLDRAPAERVGRTLERIAGFRGEDGHGFVGVDYTAHDEATLGTLERAVDGVLWVEGSPADGLRVEPDLSGRRGR